MKIHLSLLIFFASFVTRSSHGACDESTPEKQMLINNIMTILVSEYVEAIPAPESTGELDKERLCNFLTERAIRAHERECRNEELAFLHPTRQHSLDLPHRFELLKSDSNLRCEHYYRNKMSRALHYRVSIELGCRPDYLHTYNNETYERLPAVSIQEFLERRRKGLSDDQINNLYLETSHAFAQEALNLFFQETKKQVEQ